MQLKPETLEKLAGLSMCSGLGNGKDSACIMAQVAIADAIENDKPWPTPSDRPDCVCPVIRSYCIRINDSLRLWANNADRKDVLAPLIPFLMGTRSSPAAESARARIFVLAAAREIVPLYLDTAVSKGFTGLAEHAAALRAIADDAPMAEIRVLATAARMAADAAAYVAAYAAVAAYVAAAADSADAAADAAAYVAVADAYVACAAAAAAAADSATAALRPQLQAIVVRAIMAACAVQ